MAFLCPHGASQKAGLPFFTHRSGGAGRAFGGGDGGRAADEESDDIDKQSSDGKSEEQQRARQGYPKEGIEGIASWSRQSDGEAPGQQGQRELQAALTVPEAVFPMTLENRHEHCTEDPCSAQRG